MPSRNTASVVNATLSKNARRVLAAIARSGGACHCGTLAQELRLSVSTVGVHANDLYRAGLVEVRCVGPQVSEHAIEDTISQIGNGFVAWSHRGVPTRTWSR